MNPTTTLILTSVRNADVTAHPRKIIIPTDIDLAELQEALGNAGFALLGDGEYVRLRRLPESVRKHSKTKRTSEQWYLERQQSWLEGHV